MNRCTINPAAIEVAKLTSITAANCAIPCSGIRLATKITIRSVWVDAGLPSRHRAGMRSLLLASAWLLLPMPASALCRCVCTGPGIAKAVCQPDDLVAPLCQDICPDAVRPAQVTRPLAGGRAQFETVRPFDPAPGRLVDPDRDPNVNAYGLPLGTPSTLSEGPGYGATGAVQSGVPAAQR